MVDSAFFGELDPEHMQDVLSLRYGYPNSLWARQYKHNFLKGIYYPWLSSLTSNNLTASSVIYTPAAILPTKPDFFSNAVIDIHVPSFFTANGSSCSSFTDGIGNIFTWSGNTPPIFTSIPQTGNPTVAKGLNFANASGIFICSLSGPSTVNKIRMFVSVSSVASSVAVSAGGSSINQILFEVSSNSSSSLDNGIGFAIQKGVINHDNSIANKVLYCSGADNSSPISIIYKRVSTLSSIDSNKYWSLTGSHSSITFRYHNKSILPPLSFNTAYGNLAGVQCYSPMSSINTSAFMYDILLQKYSNTGTRNNTSFISNQPTNSCINTVNGLPLIHGQFGDIFDMSLSGLFCLGNGSINTRADRFTGILWNLTIFSTSDSSNVPPLSLNQLIATWTFLHQYLRYTQSPQWLPLTAFGCPSNCQVFLS